LMTSEAANAFLKTLEEPTKTSIFILTTSMENLILPTIISRCQKISLGLVSKKEIIKELEKEGVGKKVSEVISNLSAGKPGFAKRLSKKENLQKYFRNIDLLEELLIADDIDKMNLAKKIVEQRNLPKLLDLWLVYFRDLLAVRQGLFEIVVNTDRIKKIADFSKKFSPRKIKEDINLISEGQKMLAANTNPRLVLENLLLSF